MRLYISFLNGVPYQVGGALQSQFDQDVGTMALRCADADEEGFSDFLV